MAYSPPWTTVEIRLLKKYYPKFGSDTSKWPEPISRGRRGIMSQACNLGIRKYDQKLRYLD